MIHQIHGFVLCLKTIIPSFLSYQDEKLCKEQRNIGCAFLLKFLLLKNFDKKIFASLISASAKNKK